MSVSSPEPRVGRRFRALTGRFPARLLSAALGATLWIAAPAWAQTATGSGQLQAPGVQSAPVGQLQSPSVQSAPVGQPIRLIPLDPARRQGSGALPGEALPEEVGKAWQARFGVEIQGRHTALGDSLVTAEVFQRMIALLAEGGVTTLDEALAAARSIVEVRKQQEQF